MIKKNNAQEKAIQTISGQLILVACPGAGKTTTLLRRINYMITKRNINPLNILMITFTKAAADEMNRKKDLCLLSQRRNTRRRYAYSNNFLR